MKKGIAVFASEEEKKQFVTACDNEFEKRLDKAVEAARSADDLRLIMLSGPSGSGKTTAAEKISCSFSGTGKKVFFISIDDFYLDSEVNIRRAAEKGQPVDYESADALDLDLLGQVVNGIKNRKEVNCPRFDFKTGKRSGYEKIDTDCNCVFIMEGIQAVYPEIERMTESLSSLRLFIRPMGSLQCGNEIFSGDELRMFRRIVRNCNHRSSSAETEFSMWAQVRENEEKNIFPNVSPERTVLIDSMLECEINIIKPFICARLGEMRENSPYAHKAASIIKRLEGIEEIGVEHLSRESLFGEFVF